MFLGECMVANAYAVYVAARFRQDRTNALAKRIFFTSLVYLPSILMLFLLHTKTWDVEKEENALWLTQQVQALRARGREKCCHESAAVAAKESHNRNNDKECNRTIILSRHGGGTAKGAHPNRSGNGRQSNIDGGPNIISRNFSKLIDRLRTPYSPNCR